MVLRLMKKAVKFLQTKARAAQLAVWPASVAPACKDRLLSNILGKS